MGTGNQREHQRAHPRLLSEEDRLHARAGCGDCRSGVCFEHETEKTAQVEDTFRSLEWCTSRLNVPRTFLTIAADDIPSYSRSSAGLPPRRILRTASDSTVAAYGASALATASPSPPSRW